MTTNADHVELEGLLRLRYAEIDELKAENKRLEAALIRNSEWRDENKRVWAEVERLKAERQNCPPVSESEYVRRLENDIIKYEAEIERLKAAHHPMHPDLYAENVKLRDEIDRLKAALRKIADSDLAFPVMYGTEMREIARVALSD